MDYCVINYMEAKITILLGGDVKGFDALDESMAYIDHVKTLKA